MAEIEGKNESATGQKVYILVKRTKEDPVVPRLEVLDLRSSDQEVWQPVTKNIEPTEVNKGKDVVVTMREYVDLVKTWATTGYNKHMCLTEYLAAASSGRETTVEWSVPAAK